MRNILIFKFVIMLSIAGNSQYSIRNIISGVSQDTVWEKTSSPDSIFKKTAGVYSFRACVPTDYFNTVIRALDVSKIANFPTTTAGFSNSTNKNFVTDAKQTVLTNTSGTNTGDQDVSGLMVKASNLSDVGNATTARTNLGAAAASHTHAESDITSLVPDLALKAPLVSPSFTTPAIGAATGTSITVTGSIGYGTGAGGTVTQATSKTTGVTLNKICGQITMNAASLAAAAEVAFTLTNSTISAGDVVVVSIKSGGTVGVYFVSIGATSAGSCSITVGNTAGGALAEAIVLNFIVIKAVSN